MSKISIETIKRWAKLDSSSVEKFTHRANKTLSTKRIFPVEYLDNPKNIDQVKEIVSYNYLKIGNSENFQRISFSPSEKMLK